MQLWGSQHYLNVLLRNNQPLHLHRHHHHSFRNRMMMMMMMMMMMNYTWSMGGSRIRRWSSWCGRQSIISSLVIPAPLIPSKPFGLFGRRSCMWINTCTCWYIRHRGSISRSSKRENRRLRYNRYSVDSSKHVLRSATATSFASFDCRQP